jgi:enoyl-CoA hydratase/carnithine racemase
VLGSVTPTFVWGSSRETVGSQYGRFSSAGSVCPADEVMPEARKLAQEIASLPPLAVQWTKLSLNKVLRLALEQSFDTSVALEMLTFMSQDHSRATKAFVDKTAPDFEGR